MPYLYFNKDFYLYYNIINLILKSPYFNQENKKIIEKMKYNEKLYKYQTLF